MLFLKIQRSIYKCLLLAVSLQGFATSSFAEDNRIAPLWARSQAEGRCNSVGVPPALCSQGQQNAISQCGLNGTEQAFMTSNGVLPMCFGGVLVAVCTCGCFDAGTLIAVADGGETKWQAVETLTPTQSVVALADNATLRDLAYKVSGLRHVTKGPEKPLLYAIKVADGREIVLSQHHGVLLADGTTTTARQLVVGDQLVSQSGEAAPIVSITRQPAKDGYVYNFLTDRDSKAGHLIVANGFVVGDLMWQNTYQDEIGAVALRY